MVTLLVTVGVAGNKKTGVERSIAHQLLVRIKVIDGSKAFPQSIGVSLLPIVTSGPDSRQVGLLLKVSLISSFVINENDLSKLKQEEKRTNDLIKKDETIDSVLENILKVKKSKTIYRNAKEQPTNDVRVSIAIFD